MTNISNVTGFIDFAEAASRQEKEDQSKLAHWKQSLWAWVKDPNARNRGISTDKALMADPALVDLARQARNGVCSTAFCAAGHGAFHSGHRMLYRVMGYNGPDDTERGMTASDCIAEQYTGEKDERGFEIWEIVPGAKVRTIKAAGAEFYGLDNRRANMFFGGENELWHLKGMANFLAIEEGQDAPYPDMPYLDMTPLPLPLPPGDCDCGACTPTRFADLSLEDALERFPFPTKQASK